MGFRFIIALATIILMTHFAACHAQGHSDEGSPGASPQNAASTVRNAVVPKKVLSPDEIVEKKIEGPVRVEFVVETLFRDTGASTETAAPMNFKLKGVKAGNDEFNVQVAGKVFHRLHQLGIEERPEEVGKHNEVAVHRHFIGKTVRVNGTIKRLPHAEGEGVLCWLRIDSLDQIESVSSQ